MGQLYYIAASSLMLMLFTVSSLYCPPSLLPRIPRIVANIELLIIRDHCTVLPAPRKLSSKLYYHWFAIISSFPSARDVKKTCRFKDIVPHQFFLTSASCQATYGILRFKMKCLLACKDYNENPTYNSTRVQNGWEHSGRRTINKPFTNLVL